MQTCYYVGETFLKGNTMFITVNRVFFALLLTFLIGFSNHSFALSPALFKVEKAGVTSYLFGTVHVGDKNMNGLPKKITQAIEQTDEVIVEVNIEALNAFEVQKRSIPFMTLPQGRTLKDEISTEHFEALKQYFAAKQINIALFDNLAPWAVMVTMMQIEYQNLGYVEDFGIDKQVIAHAKKHNKPIGELETLEQQLEMLSTLGVKGDLMISTTLEQLKDVEQYFLDLVNAWKKGDMDTLNKYYHLSFDDSDYGKFSEEVMLTQRNNNWVKKLAPRLTKESLFIAVGALHLPEKYGLIAQLKAQGFNITRL